MSPDPQTPGSPPPKPSRQTTPPGLTPPKSGLVSEAAKNQTAPIVLPGMNTAFPPRRPPPARPAAGTAAAKPPVQTNLPPQTPSSPTDTPVGPTTPKTIQLKRPSGVLRVPQEPASGAHPQTIRLARPGGAPSAPFSPAPSQTLDDASKNATARIVLDGLPGQSSARSADGPTPRRPPTRITPATVDAASKDKTARIALDIPPPSGKSPKPPTGVGLVKPESDMLDEAARNKTTRIVLSDSDLPPVQKPKTGSVSLVPPEIASADTVVASSPSSTAKKSTTRVVDLGLTEPGKRATSRIILEDMEPPSPAGTKRSTAPISAGGTTAPSAGPKTIRLKRPTGAIMVPREPTADVPSTVKTIKLAKPGAAAAVPPTIVASAPDKPRKETTKIVMEDENQASTTAEPKRSTARITATEDEASPPETIRLRRPSTIVAVPPGGLQTPQSDAGRKTETTRIELVKPEDQAPMTQRRTVKLRRPDLDKGTPEENEEQESPKTSADLRPVDILPGGKKRRQAEETDADESIHIAFSILSVVALLVLGLVTYVLAAQAFAPDFTLPIPAFLL